MKNFDASKLEVFFSLGVDSDDETTDFLTELIVTFKKNAVNYISEIKSACEEEDKEKLKKNIHPFKSSAGTVGLMGIFIEGDKIDKKTIHQSWDIIKPEVENVLSMYKEGILLLDDYIKSKT